MNKIFTNISINCGYIKKWSIFLKITILFVNSFFNFSNYHYLQIDQSIQRHLRMGVYADKFLITYSKQ